MRKINNMLFFLLLSILQLGSCKSYDYFLETSNYISKIDEKYGTEPKECVKHWGIRPIDFVGSEYNYEGTMEKAYVIYYFDTIFEKNYLGRFYESDAFYFKDLVKLLQENNYANPAGKQWQIPFYCSVYYFSNDTINLCTPHEWDIKNPLYERKTFKVKCADGCNENYLARINEYKFNNPDPLYATSYNINLYSTKELEWWVDSITKINKRENERKKYTDAFHQNISYTKIDTSVTSGWAYFGELETKKRWLFSDDYLKYNFLHQNWYYFRCFKAKSRFTSKNPRIIGRKVVPLYELPIYDMVTSEFGKGKMINEITNLYSYEAIAKTIVSDPNSSSKKQYIWIKVKLKKNNN